MPEILTIGHSNHSEASFLELLQQHGITALADVRSHPYSRYLPHFSQAALKRSLPTAGIAYVFLGQQLGARPDNPACYVEGQARYELIAGTAEFKLGLERLYKGLEKYRIALMCAEQDPITCHRAILVCHHLEYPDLQILHILKSGELETHAQLEERLLKLHHLDPETVSPPHQQLSLLDLMGPEINHEPQGGNSPPLSPEASLQLAYQRQAEKIAYVESSPDRDTQEEPDASFA